MIILSSALMQEVCPRGNFEFCEDRGKPSSGTSSAGLPSQGSGVELGRVGLAVKQKMKLQLRALPFLARAYS